jgi:hypothetical protein
VLASSEKLLSASAFVIAPMNRLSLLVVPGRTPPKTLKALRAGGAAVHQVG